VKWSVPSGRDGRRVPVNPNGEQLQIEYGGTEGVACGNLHKSCSNAVAAVFRPGIAGERELVVREPLESESPFLNWRTACIGFSVAFTAAGGLFKVEASPEGSSSWVLDKLSSDATAGSRN
jgi:hypothetical protein